MQKETKPQPRRMLISRTDTVFANQVFLPTQTYRVCVTKTELTKSRKGNAMVNLTCEIFEPEEVEHEGNQVKIAGQTFTLYLVLNPALVGKQKESNMAQVWRFMDKTGVTELCEKDDSGEPIFDTERVEEYFQGLEFNIPLSSSERIKRMRQTPAQKASGEQGDPILDGEGNEQSDGWQIEADSQAIDYNCQPSRRENMPNLGNTSGEAAESEAVV